MEPYLCSLYIHSWRTHWQLYWYRNINYSSGFTLPLLLGKKQWKCWPRLPRNSSKYVQKMFESDVFYTENVVRRVRKIAKSDNQLRLICLYFRPHGTTGLPSNIFSGNLIFEYFSKLYWRISSYIKTSQEWRAMYTLSNKNQSAWNFLGLEPEVTCGTVAIIIRVVLFSPYLRIRGVSLSSIHYNQSHRVYINRRQQYICLIWN